MRIALVAGEASGDTLGAALIDALRRRFPQVEFGGVAGPRMIAAGCKPWFHSEELGVMGLTEILRHLPRLLRLRAALQRRILEWKPDVFIGVDFKEFNLGLARRLKKQGLRTVQYVSPQVWAWRQGRARTIGEAVDLILCLFPFEPDFYREYGVRATFVGHPLADQIPDGRGSRRRACRARHPAGRARAGGPARQPARRSGAAGRALRGRGRVAGRALSRAGVHRSDGDAGPA